MKSPHKLLCVACRLGAAGLLLAILSLAGCACCPPASPAAPASATAKASAPASITTEWTPLFDGITLKGWKETDFAGGGEVSVENGMIILEPGVALTGVHWTNESVLPKTNYEIALEAKRIDGNDFFCGLTVPVADSHCSLILGGWGGTLVGISSLDQMDASENETTKFLFFEQDRWYPVRMRVTPEKLEAWIDGEKLVDVVITDREVTVRAGEIEDSRPLGVASYQTKAALRDIRMRRLSE
jgi:hypothetical protein